MTKESREGILGAPRGLLGPHSPQDELRVEVRRCLTRAGLTQAEVARRLGLSQKHVSRMLNGRAVLNLHWADKIARLCGRRLTIASKPLRKGTD